MKDELVDIMVYFLWLVDKMDVDFDVVVLEKMEKNGKKYFVLEFKGFVCKYNEEK